MTTRDASYNEIDDYIADLTDDEREHVATAEAAIELAFLLHSAREARGLTQAEAAGRAALHQQAISRFEQAHVKLANTKFETLRKYLTALDYILQLGIRDAATGDLIEQISLHPPQHAAAAARREESLHTWQPSPDYLKVNGNAAGAIATPAVSSATQQLGGWQTPGSGGATSVIQENRTGWGSAQEVSTPNRASVGAVAQYA